MAQAPANRLYLLNGLASSAWWDTLAGRFLNSLLLQPQIDASPDLFRLGCSGLFLDLPQALELTLIDPKPEAAFGSHDRRNYTYILATIQP